MRTRIKSVSGDDRNIEVTLTIPADCVRDLRPFTPKAGLTLLVVEQIPSSCPYLNNIENPYASPEEKREKWEENRKARMEDAIGTLTKMLEAGKEYDDAELEDMGREIWKTMELYSKQ